MFVWQKPRNQITALRFWRPPPSTLKPQGDMEVFSLDELQTSPGSSKERLLKRPRSNEEESEVPTERCRRHPSLYLEDGNVVLRCEE